MQRAEFDSGREAAIGRRWAQSAAAAIVLYAMACATLHAQSPAAPSELLADAPPIKGFAFETAADFIRAYREKRVTPDEIADRLVANLKAAVTFDQGQSART